MGSTIQLAVFNLDDRQFGVLLENVERVIRAVDPTPLPQVPPIILGVIDLHGTVIPVFSVRYRVSKTDRPIGLNDQFVIVRSSKRTVALVVDQVRDIVTFPVEAVVRAEAILPRWNDIQGVVQLEGGLILIQYLDRFLSVQEDKILEEALREQPQHGS